MSEEMLKYWKEKHEENNPGMLTGSIGKNVWNNLAITDRVKPGSVVLNIGVGTGRCTRELVAAGCKVDALDITEKAIDKVMDVIDNAFISEYVENLPKNKYDLIISHLVAQHMSDADLREQLKYAIQALKDDCRLVDENHRPVDEPIFAMQIVGALNGTDGSDDILHQKGGGVCRNLSKMAHMVEDAGGTIIMAKRFGVYMQWKSYGYYLHIARSIK